MRNRFLGLTFALFAALAPSPRDIRTDRDDRPRQRPKPPQHRICQESGGAHARAPDKARKYTIYELAFTISNDVPPMTPWAEAKYKANRPNLGPRAVSLGESNDPIMQCFPPGVPRVYLIRGEPIEFAQIPGRVLMIYEYDHFIRNIYTDGRSHPADPNPSWMGDSIGKWDGDTLVVDTIGFNDKTWLDNDGHPHSEDLHLVERIPPRLPRRVDHRRHHRGSEGLYEALDRTLELRIEARLESRRNGLRGQRNVRRHAAEIGRQQVARQIQSGETLWQQSPPIVIPSEERNLFLNWTREKQIPRFARNDKTG